MTAPTEDAVLAALEPASRARIEALLAKQWALPGEHPLARLHGACLGDYVLAALLGSKNNVGSRYFQLFIADNDGRLSEDTLALGLHNTGPFPAFNWIELTQYRAVLRIGGEALDLPTTQLDGALFEQLAQFVPPGGHIMVEYDSPTQRASERTLTRGYPPVCSPLGHLMFRIGCRSYRDWYISEGGREGPRKLQGFMPLNDEIRREKEAKLREELDAFLSRSEVDDRDEWREVARRNAQTVLGTLSAA
ncbi:MAG: DUF1122 family protein [Gaiellales bacterium]